MEDLPYVRAVRTLIAPLHSQAHAAQMVREAGRWRTVAPAGIPHRLEVDDIITVKGEEYFVPAGTTVVACVHAIHYDEDLFPSPEVFRPERYLHADGTYNEAMPTAVFGFGRRICPGLHLAEASLFIVLATLLWAFDFAPELDDRGEPIMPEMAPEKWSASAASCVPCARLQSCSERSLRSVPPPFKLKITPRSADVTKHIDAAIANERGLRGD
jgi:hypothetical protein